MYYKLQQHCDKWFFLEMSILGNEYRGTDSTIFAPYMDKNDGIWVLIFSIKKSY